MLINRSLLRYDNDADNVEENVPYRVRLKKTKLEIVGKICTLVEDFIRVASAHYREREKKAPWTRHDRLS